MVGIPTAAAIGNACPASQCSTAATSPRAASPAIAAIAPWASIIFFPAPGAAASTSPTSPKSSGICAILKGTRYTTRSPSAPPTCIYIIHIPSSSACTASTGTICTSASTEIVVKITHIRPATIAAISAYPSCPCATASTATCPA